jgi:hypothetical protein
VRAVSLKPGVPAQGLALGIGWISLGIGLALTLAPRRSAAFLGWEDREGLARIIGAGDLIVGTGLLSDRRRPRWMLARMFLNVVLAGVYARVLADGTARRKRAGGGLILMAVLTVVDYSLSRRLRGADAS